MIRVTGRSIGSRRPLFADWAVPPPPRPESGDGGLKLRDLIEHVVRFEIAAFEERQEARRLDRVLSPEVIERGEAAGRIAPEGRGGTGRVNIDAAVAAAWEAFEDGLYLVVIDEREYRSLDEAVFLTDDSRMTFLRLVFLAGA
jgi:hypothetical protein